MSEILIQSASYTATLSSLGAQVLSWRDNTTPLFYEGSSHKRSGIPSLFPFADPLENDIFEISGKPIGQHGFARNTKWSLQSHTQTSVQYLLTHHDLDTDVRDAYPFLFELYLTVRIDNNTLTYTLECKNIDQKPMPIMPGIHPYFPLQHIKKSQLSINNSEFKPQNIDWNAEMTGNYYPFSGSISTTLDCGNITIQADKEVFKHLVVWSQPQTMPDSDFVCLELFSGKANQININPIIINPNDTWTSTVVFEHTNYK